MMIVNRIAIRAILLFFTAGAVLSCAGIQRAHVYQENSRIPAKNLRSYQFQAASPVLSRIQAAPVFVLNYLRTMDSAPDYSSYALTPTELRMVKKYLSLLPGQVKKALRERLIAIYFINNFRGAGLTEYILSDSNDIYTIMVFNPDALKMDLSRWLTYRENSCFIETGQKRKIEINAGAKYTGFFYALVHESAHVLDYAEGYTPYPELNIQRINNRKAAPTPFVANIWEELTTPVAPYDYSLRKNITFYGLGGPKISLADAGAVYEALAHSPFVSLYGSVSWAEDFADFTMFYHLTQKLGEPYEIRYVTDSGRVETLRPMQLEKIRARFPLMQQLYRDE